MLGLLIAFFALGRLADECALLPKGCAIIPLEPGTLANQAGGRVKHTLVTDNGIENRGTNALPRILFSSGATELLGTMCGSFLLVTAANEAVRCVTIGFFEKDGGILAVRTDRDGKVATRNLDLASVRHLGMGPFFQSDSTAGEVDLRPSGTLLGIQISLSDRGLCLVEVEALETDGKSLRGLKQDLRRAYAQLSKFLRGFIKADQAMEELTLLHRLHRLLPVMIFQSKPGVVVPSIATHAKAALRADKVVIVPLSPHSDLDSSLDGLVFRGVASRRAENDWLESVLTEGRKVISSKRAEVVYHGGVEGSVTIVCPLGTRKTIYGLLAVHFDDPYVDVKQKLILVEHFRRLVVASIEAANRHKETTAKTVSQERSKTAMDLHDGIAQTLFSLSLEAEIILRKLADGNDVVSGVKQLKAMQRHIRGALDEVRKVVDKLNPDELTHLSVIALVKRCVSELSRGSSIKMSVEVSGKQTGLPIRKKRELFKILHEALANAVKHSGATKVSVAVDFSPSVLSISVRDDGIGFDVGKQLAELAAGRGIGNMRSRAEALGGELDIESVSNIGTCVTVLVPLGK